MPLIPSGSHPQTNHLHPPTMNPPATIHPASRATAQRNPLPNAQRSADPGGNRMMTISIKMEDMMRAAWATSIPTKLGANAKRRLGMPTRGCQNQKGVVTLSRRQTRETAFVLFSHFQIRFNATQRAMEQKDWCIRQWRANIVEHG